MEPTEKSRRQTVRPANAPVVGDPKGIRKGGGFQLVTQYPHLRGMLTIEEQVAYRTLIITYNILKDEEMKEQMGRKVWKPDYDSLAGYLREDWNIRAC